MIALVVPVRGATALTLHKEICTNNSNQGTANWSVRDTECNLTPLRSGRMTGGLRVAYDGRVILYDPSRGRLDVIGTIY